MTHNSLIFDNNGNALMGISDGVTFPASYDFNSINNYVHDLNIDFEDLQNLCLVMANHIAELNKKINSMGGI